MCENARGPLRLSLWEVNQFIREFRFQENVLRISPLLAIRVHLATKGGFEYCCARATSTSLNRGGLNTLLYRITAIFLKSVATKEGGSKYYCTENFGPQCTICWVKSQDFVQQTRFLWKTYTPILVTLPHRAGSVVFLVYQSWNPFSEAQPREKDEQQPHQQQQQQIHWIKVWLHTRQKKVVMLQVLLLDP